MTPAPTVLEILRHDLESMVKIRAGMTRPKGARFICNEDLVLRFGKTFDRAPIPEWARLSSARKACFYNCWQAVARPNKWVYVEGFASFPTMGFAIHHAWLTRTDQPDKAFDPTWDADQKDIAYIGIPFKREFVIDMKKRSNHRELSVLDVPWAGWPLLTGKDRIEDVIAL